MSSNQPYAEYPNDFLTAALQHFNNLSNETSDTKDRGDKLSSEGRQTKNESSSSTLDKKKYIKNHLQEKYVSLVDIPTRYDNHLWSDIEEYLNTLWPTLETLLHLGVKYGLYEEVGNVFFEIRNFLHVTGRIKERIYFASWLRRQAESRNDQVRLFIALSSLTWSYTSSGRYQNLEKASQLAERCFHITDESCFDKFMNIKTSNLSHSVFGELCIEILENNIRLSIRSKSFDQGLINISRAEKLKDSVLKKNISEHLYERFSITLIYHKGIIHYLYEDYPKSEELFNCVLEKANDLKWNRIAKGAQSWLVTLSTEQEKYNQCSLLDEYCKMYHEGSHNIQDKYDAFCYAAKARISYKNGNREEVEFCDKLLKENGYPNLDLKECKRLSPLANL